MPGPLSVWWIKAHLLVLSFVWTLSCFTILAPAQEIVTTTITDNNKTYTFLITKTKTNTFLQTPSPTNIHSLDSADSVKIHTLDSTGSGTLYVLGTLTSFANIIGCSAIIWMTYRTSRKRLEPLSPSQRFPLYMALLDLSIGIIIMPNLLYAMVNDHLLPGLWCTGFGFTTSTLLSMNMMLMAIIAIVTYFRVCRGQIIDLGTKDWILFAIIIVFSLFVSSVSQILHGFGPDTFWCFTKGGASGSQINLILMVTFAYLVTVITTFSYLMVIKRINRVEAILTTGAYKRTIKTQRKSPSSLYYSSPNLESKERWEHFTSSNRSFTPNSSYLEEEAANFGSFLTPHASYMSPPHNQNNPSTNPSPYSSINQNPGPFSPDGLALGPPDSFLSVDSTKFPTPSQQRIAASITRATRRMSSYIFLQLVQYTPTIIYSLCLLVNHNRAWVYILTIGFLNLGGVAKAISFIRYENNKRRPNTVLNTAYKSPKLDQPGNTGNSRIPNLRSESLRQQSRTGSSPHQNLQYPKAPTPIPSSQKVYLDHVSTLNESSINSGSTRPAIENERLFGNKLIGDSKLRYHSPNEISTRNFLSSSNNLRGPPPNLTIKIPLNKPISNTIQFRYTIDSSPIPNSTFDENTDYDSSLISTPFLDATNPNSPIGESMPSPKSEPPQRSRDDNLLNPLNTQSDSSTLSTKLHENISEEPDNGVGNR